MRLELSLRSGWCRTIPWDREAHRSCRGRLVGLAASSRGSAPPYCLLGRTNPISFMSICKSSQVSFLAAGFLSK